MYMLSAWQRSSQSSASTRSSSGAQYTLQSLEIIGISKQMLDEMMAGLEDAEAVPKQCKSDYTVVLEVNAKWITADEKVIEVKPTRIGELGEKIAMLKNDYRRRKGRAGDHRGGEHKSFYDTELITTKQTRDSKMEESDELTAESEKFTADIRQLVAEIAALGEGVAALDAMKAKKVKK